MATSGSARRSRLGFGIGLVALAVALGSSVVLARGHLGAHVPGCGPDSPCARLSNGPWGRVPGIDWPLAFAGASWFAALLAWWLASRGRVGRGFEWLVRVGALASFVLVGVMIASRELCPWCLAAHLVNVVFWLVVELSAREGGLVGWPAAAGVATFAGVAIAFASFEHASRRTETARAETELAASSAAISKAAPGAFTGRYRLGPDPAKVRLVAFTDYQCPDCKRLEAQLRAAVAAGPSVSLSVKHFPMCADCNPNVPKPSPHPNACWAALAAEAAGVVGGADGFWKMHTWLFAHDGAFTNPELDGALGELGFDRAEFLAAMGAPQTLRNVQDDIAEATRLGLARTPMIFVNGVELRGWNAPDAVLRAVAAAFTKGSVASTAIEDRPAQALEKTLGDWREAPRVAIPPDAFPRAIGPENAKVSIVVFGDFQEPFTSEVDVACRTLVAVRSDTRYAFRHFPVDKSCNPSAERTLHPLACAAAHVAEATAALAGIDTYWRMHDWLMRHPGEFSDLNVAAEATALGVDPDVLRDAAKLPELDKAIADDVAAAKKLGIDAIPFVFVDGRQVSRWKLGDENVLPRIVEEAAKK